MNKKETFDISYGDALAATVPDFAGRSFSPPLSFWKDGEDLVILGADGRKVCFTPQQIDVFLASRRVPVPGTSRISPAALVPGTPAPVRRGSQGASAPIKPTPVGLPEPTATPVDHPRLTAPDGISYPVLSGVGLPRRIPHQRPVTHKTGK
jgi:hypothetical protein